MFRNDSRFTHSGDPEGRRVLTLVKPEGVLYGPQPGDHLFKDAQQIPVKEPRLSFMPGLPEKEISLPDPMVQQAIARTLAGVSSAGFQALTPKTMATVAEIAKTAPRSKAEALALQAKEAEAEAARVAEELRVAEAAQQAAEEEAQQAAQQAAEEAEKAEQARQDQQAKADQEAKQAQDAQDAQDAQETQDAKAAQEAQEPQEAIAAHGPEEAHRAEQTPGVENAQEAQPPQQAQHAGDAQQDEEASQDETGQGEADTQDLAVPEGMQLVSAQDLQQVFDEAFAQGREAGIAEAKPLQEESFQQGYEEGYAKGQASTRDEMEAEVQLAVEDLKDFTGRLATAARDTEAFYAPLLKLSMHLAEQLVRGDLSVSPHAIERLIQTALEEFNQDPAAPVMVRINPEDLDRLKGHGAVLPSNMTLRADPTLALGSVRVQMNGALIEDLIEHRAEALWASLTKGLEAGSPPPSFLQNVALIKEALDQVEPAAASSPRPQTEIKEGASAVVLEQPGGL